MAMGPACLHLSCPSAVLQSVLCGADALIPVQTGAAGSASLTLLGNGSLIYQVRVGAAGRGRAHRVGWRLRLQFRCQAFSATTICPPPSCPPGASGGYRQRGGGHDVGDQTSAEGPAHCPVPHGWTPARRTHGECCRQSWATVPMCHSAHMPQCGLWEARLDE